ncbi:translation initiation factor eIF3 subunit [Sorochytrium milnesiophthora]
MRPIVCQGHTRPLTRVKYNTEGDLLFSAAKDALVCVWFAHNGELLGTYKGHNGVVWDFDVNHDSTRLITASADSSTRLWDVRTGKSLFKWTTSSPVRAVAFTMAADMAMMVTDKKMGQPCTLILVAIKPDVQDISEEPINIIVPDASLTPVTVARWGPMDKHIFMGHENGTVTVWNPLTGELVKQKKLHSGYITDLQFSLDLTYFITSSKDHTAKLHDCNLKPLKTYQTERPVNSAAICPVKEHIVLGGGQDASQVTTTTARVGKFESRFFHKILEQELGRIRGHFGPINTLAVQPDNKAFTSGSEDGYIRIHHFDPDFFSFRIDQREP